jgi:hypothetical protein
MKKKVKKVIISKDGQKKEKSVKLKKYNMTSDDEYLFNELARKEEIYNEIIDSLRFRNDFIILETSEDYFLVAKFCNLSIQKIHNKEGFTPVSSVKDSKECLLRLIHFGSDFDRSTLAYVLKRGGCPVITINNKYEIENKLLKD